MYSNHSKIYTINLFTVRYHNIERKSMEGELFAKVKLEINSISDNELFDVLDCASEELKRRNGLLAPSIHDTVNQSPQANLKMVIEALANLGNQIK